MPAPEAARTPSAPGTPHARFAAALALWWLGGFLLLLTAAALAYPGGSWVDRSHRGFDLFVNYWCDLMRARALNGAPNLAASVLAKAAFCALAIALAAFWRAAAALGGPARLARWSVACGTLSCVAIVLVALAPYDTLDVLHSIAALSAGGLGSLATLCAMAGSLRVGPVASWRHLWAAALLVAAGVNIVIYLRIVVGGAEDTGTIPVVQPLATLFLALWMVSTVLDVRGTRLWPALRPSREGSRALGLAALALYVPFVVMAIVFQRSVSCSHCKDAAWWVLPSAPGRVAGLLLPLLQVDVSGDASREVLAVAASLALVVGLAWLARGARRRIVLGAALLASSGAAVLLGKLIRM